MNAARRNAKIAQAKARRPFVWDVVDRWSNRLIRMVRTKIRRAHKGDGPLRLCAGEAPVDPPPVIVPKHVLRRQRQKAQREREAR